MISFLFYQFTILPSDLLSMTLDFWWFFVGVFIFWKYHWPVWMLLHPTLMCPSSWSIPWSLYQARGSSVEHLEFAEGEIISLQRAWTHRHFSVIEPHRHKLQKFVHQFWCHEQIEISGYGSLFTQNDSEPAYNALATKYVVRNPPPFSIFWARFHSLRPQMR